MNEIKIINVQPLGSDIVQVIFDSLSLGRRFVKIKRDPGGLIATKIGFTSDGPLLGWSDADGLAELAINAPDAPESSYETMTVTLDDAVAMALREYAEKHGIEPEQLIVAFLRFVVRPDGKALLENMFSGCD